MPSFGVWMLCGLVFLLSEFLADIIIRFLRRKFPKFDALCRKHPKE